MEYHYQCPVCKYLVEPERGDLDSGIKPGVEWEEYPEDWVCPICGCPKDRFIQVENPYF